ncbi:hypothetical protein TUMSATVNIG1_59990 (plasmid) [Vibrio nigripulchritudo]|uniref:hypothetical protein n=1 Tax=Vibrio nigripulchritudo TaxID=28173 RepID=UPI00190C20BD|nr:hypothetical protein [Vibrio nigripulchritudo]BCL74013.1 hypothetical protein VNTUMSATTG_59500 [Vibrio nigripulchritudo]BDU35390.1 hypothetical protein TUMSATVNIG1_59990 [Vibrio nigripulchritudo]
MSHQETRESTDTLSQLDEVFGGEEGLAESEQSKKPQETELDFSDFAIPNHEVEQDKRISSDFVEAIEKVVGEERTPEQINRDDSAVQNDGVERQEDLSQLSEIHSDFEEEELSSPEPESEDKKTPLWRKPTVLISFIVLFLFILFAGTGWLVYSSLTGGAQPQTKQNPSSQPNAEHGKSNPEEFGSDEEQLSGPEPLDIETVVLSSPLESTTDLPSEPTNTAPVVKKTVEELRSEVTALRSQKESLQKALRDKDSNFSDLNQKYKVLSNHFDKEKREKESLLKDYETAKSQLSDQRDLNKDLTIQVEALKDENQVALFKLDEKKEELGEAKKQMSLLRSSRKNYEFELQKRLEKVSKQLEKLSSQAEVPKQSQLAKLTMVSVDPKTREMSVIVHRVNGTRTEQTLVPGETIFGRGKIESIDEYGCIRFETGSTYEPEHGYCHLD